MSSSGLSNAIPLHKRAHTTVTDECAAYGRVATFPFYMQILSTNANDYGDVDDDNGYIA